MAIDKNSIGIVLVFVCGILAGALLTGLFIPLPVHSQKLAVYTQHAPEPIGPYSQAVQSDNLIFLSGQIGIDPVTGNLTEGTENQTTRAMENLREVLAASDLGFSDVVQTRIYLLDLNDWTIVNRIYGSYFNDTFPARAAVQVAGLPKGARVEIEMVAQKR